MVVKITANTNNGSGDVFILQRDLAGEYPSVDAALAAAEKRGYKIIDVACLDYWLYPSDMSDDEIERDIAGYDAIGGIEVI